MEMQTADHSKLLHAAARQILRPMGLVQKGRSRTWLDDHGWWLCVVEFQPSGWSRGSYLNVGCCWLWQMKENLSFDEGYRIAGFQDFQDEQQFAPKAEQLARRAAAEIARYRRLFPDIRVMADHYWQNRPKWFWQNPLGFWPSFDAAVACALAGNGDGAHTFFRNVIEAKDDKRAWVLAAQADAEQLDRLVEDVHRFREVVGERVRKTRELQKLPSVSIDWNADGDGTEEDNGADGARGH